MQQIHEQTGGCDDARLYDRVRVTTSRRSPCLVRFRRDVILRNGAATGFTPSNYRDHRSPHPGSTNERSWLYRIRPSVRHMGQYESYEHQLWRSAPTTHEGELPVGQRRWDPIPMPEDAVHFVEGVRTMTTAGDVVGQSGFASHVYLANDSMTRQYMLNADGELMFVPEEGSIRLRTELGVMEVEPGEIAVVPRGMVFALDLVDGPARGYLCENYGAKFTLPERGPIGGKLSREREGFQDSGRRVRGYRGGLHDLPEVVWASLHYDHRTLAAGCRGVAWQLRAVQIRSARLFAGRAPSPSTTRIRRFSRCLTAPSGEAGTANIDFVIFPDRWLVGEDTFRPPWYHRNIMSEFMGAHLRAIRREGRGLLAGRYEPAQHDASARTRPRCVREGVEGRSGTAKARGGRWRSCGRPDCRST